MELLQNKLPLVAILRGINTNEASQYVEILIEQGYHFIEVPLNSPNAIETISLLHQKFHQQCCIGAGTVTDEQALQQVLDTGVRLIVTPNLNLQVIAKAKAADCLIFVGVMTPSEAYSAIHAGAQCLKFYPAEIIGANGFKAIKSILPSHIACFPVGGITADQQQMQQYIQAGAAGFGIGGALYRPGIPLLEFEKKAKAFKASYENIILSN